MSKFDARITALLNKIAQLYWKEMAPDIAQPFVETTSDYGLMPLALALANIGQQCYPVEASAPTHHWVDCMPDGDWPDANDGPITEAFDKLLDTL